MDTIALNLIRDRKFGELVRELKEREPADISLLLEEVPEENLVVVFRMLPKELAAEVFVEMSPEDQENLLRAFNDSEIEDVFSELYLDDAADILEEMPANVVTRILRHSDPTTRNRLNELLNYPRDSAGSIMTTEFVSLKKEITVADAFTQIRHTGVDKETIYTCYITDSTRHLLGYVTAKTLMLSDDQQLIEDIMDNSVIFVTTMEDQETVAQIFDRYDFLALPVTDAEQRLVGIITVDDIIDVINEEATEDIEKMAAILPSDKPYLRTTPLELWKARIPWLLFLMVSATFTGMIIASFESALAVCGALTAFIPMLMDTGGNSGSQASVTVIRGISLGQIRFGDILKVVWKEAQVGALCALTLAAINIGKILLVDRLLLGNPGVTLTVTLVVCVTLFFTVLLAKFVGCVLPLLAKKIGFDPAVMASPFITTIVDALSLLIYFRVAKIFLGF